jgi:small multidrug resistance pump
MGRLVCDECKRSFATDGEPTHHPRVAEENCVNGYVWLSVAIAGEIIATSMLKASDGFSKLLPSLITVVGYVTAFWALSHSMRTVPVGIGYALWSGVGIVAITAIAWIWFKQQLDVPALLGMGLILAGVVVINVFSKSVA